MFDCVLGVKMIFDCMRFSGPVLASDADGLIALHEKTESNVV